MHAYATSSDRTKPFALLAVLSVVTAVALQGIFGRIDLAPAWLLSPPTVGATFGIFYLALDGFAWRWPALRRLGIVDTPVIEGMYEGRLRSSWDNADRPVRIEIDQTWSKIAVRLEVSGATTSTSYSTAAALDPAGHSLARLTYTFHNQVRPGHADADMHDQDGTADVTIDAAGKLNGRYFNFRGRQGTLELQRLKP